MSAETVAVDVADGLRAHLPSVLARRELLAAVDTRIAWDSPRVVPYQEGALTVFPAVEVVVTTDRVIGHELLDNGEIWNYVEYSARVFATVHGADHETTDRARKRLITAVKNVVQSPATGMPGEVGRATRTSYSQIGKDRDSRTLAAAYIDVAVTVLEPPYLPDPDDVPVEIHTVVVDVDKLDAPDD